MCACLCMCLLVCVWVGGGRCTLDSSLPRPFNTPLPQPFHPPTFPPFPPFQTHSRAFAEILIVIGVPNVHVGMYALLGSGAFLGGLMRMSAAMALILMEMTTSPQQLPFLMMVLVVAKQVREWW
jgi:hypothetical protein